MPVAAGERFVVLEDHRVDNVTSWALTSWAAPATGSFECTLPAGLVLISDSGQLEGARGFPCIPEDYEANEALLVPKRDRTASKYGGYWFVLLESEIGTWFDRA
jgi:hypothetical protein